jgi:hypothetical protein
MKPSKRFLTTVLTLALGLGVWSMAVSFSSSGFSAGDTLSAADLNDLLNGNFDKAETAIDELGTTKFDKGGGAISGRTSISAAASSDGGGNPSSVLRVHNTSADKGSAAVFQSQNSSDAGAVSIKQLGAGPALTLKASGSGPLLTGASAADVTLIVENDGSIKIGNMGSGTGDPALHLDASAGTITNNVGSGLPLAFGAVNRDGIKLSGTSNWTPSVAGTGTTYYIELDGASYDRNKHVAVATVGGRDAASITISGAGRGSINLLALSPRDAAGNRVAEEFSFVIYSQ